MPNSSLVHNDLQIGLAAAVVDDDEPQLPGILHTYGFAPPGNGDRWQIRFGTICASSKLFKLGMLDGTHTAVNVVDITELGLAVDVGKMDGDGNTVAIFNGTTQRSQQVPDALVSRLR
ncbi:Inactive dipeptidyl peptidase, putative [Babesia ovata]|uniref:Inactive dipeptidyl peptidase, putative n=1 Tax=Babesia ovata TaxID=189622 RepID=A0A2H6KDM3_9APIC|nr:Inactive dipeptidyl peptidase, putative [Babesia ovata]GBE61074.1 Inactive dipeptidyl peptidase, putative [Babesia ovata]